MENRYPFPKNLKIELPYDLAISMISTGFLFLWMVGLVIYGSLTSIVPSGDGKVNIGFSGKPPTVGKPWFSW